jgi:hypothetical protein
LYTGRPTVSRGTAFIPPFSILPPEQIGATGPSSLPL